MLKFIETIVDHENYVSKEDKKKHKHQPITNLKLHLATCNKVCEQEHVEDGDVDHQLIWSFNESFTESDMWSGTNIIHEVEKVYKHYWDDLESLLIWEDKHWNYQEKESFHEENLMIYNVVFISG